MFLQGLETDNWRGKFTSIEALGNMAHCAPRQISAFIPDIVKELRDVINDTHEKVCDLDLVFGNVADDLHSYIWKIFNYIILFYYNGVTFDKI